MRVRWFVVVCSTAWSYSLSLGLLEKAEKVRYITYTLITPGCSRPEVGCTAGGHTHTHTHTLNGTVWDN